jgi:dephospho-CoA kinase
MTVIGLTGGIGSGKSTVSSLFKDFGATVIDCDAIALSLVEPDKPSLIKIIEHFGITLLNEDGTLNRRKLREIIFKDHSERKWLQDLLHPQIFNEIKNQVSQVQTPYAIAVIPLLFETEAYDLINRILVVDSPEELQIQRTMLRDDCTERQVKRIINTQASRQQRLSKADDVIINDGNVSSLKRQVEKLHQYYLSLVN